MGGNSPQWRVNETAARIARGEVRLALIAGAEAMHGLQLARKAGVKLALGPRPARRRWSATRAGATTTSSSATTR